MDFNNYTIKTKYKNKSSEELQEAKTELMSDLEGDDISRRDRKLVEKEIMHIELALKFLEDTVSADIANVETNLMAPCSNKSGCECQKCKLLKRDKPALIVQESTGFGTFFGK